MKVGELVKAPYLCDHDKNNIGIVLEISSVSVRVLWSNGEGEKNVFPHLLEKVQ